MAWLLLALAITAEVLGTLFLRASEGLTRVVPTVVSGLGYVAAFSLLSQVLRLGMPLGIAYGIWAASGVALVALASRVVFGETLGPMSVAGIVLIMGGVLLVELGHTAPAEH